MVVYGQRFDYSEAQISEQAARVARCRSEAARRGRQQARRWAAKRRQAQGRAMPVPEKGCKPPSRL